MVLLQAVREHGRPGPRARRLEPGPARLLGIGLDGARVELEAQQAAFDRTVEERVLAVGAQSQRAAERRVAGEHGRLPAREAGDEPAAERGVERRELFLVAESHPVRRVDHHEARRQRRLLEIRQVATLEHEVVAEAGGVRICDCRAHGALFAVEAAQPPRAQAGEIAPRLGRLAQRRPGRRVVLPPALEPEPPAQQARRDAGRHQRRLDHQRAGAAHRIEEGAAPLRDLRPARAQQQRSGEVLLERRLDARLPVAAPVQRIAREVDAEGRAFARETDADPQIGPVRVDRGPGSRRLADAIDDRVLHLERGELRVTQPRRALADGVHGQRAFRREVLQPVDVAHAVVQCLRRRRRHLGQREQHAARGARVQAGEVRVRERTGERHAGRVLASRLDAERTQFAGQQVGDVARARGEELQRGAVRHGAPRASSRTIWRRSTRSRQRPRMR